MSTYIKRLCILNQVNTGFSANGLSVSGLAKLEIFDGYLTANISLINFSLTSKGVYTCLIVDNYNNREIFEIENNGCYLRKKTKLDINKALLCYIFFNNESQTIVVASGQFGNININVEKIKKEIFNKASYPQKINNSTTNVDNLTYQDDLVATENYYEYEKVNKEKKNEFKCNADNNENEPLQRENKKEEVEKKTVNNSFENEENKNLCLLTEIELEKSCVETSYFDKIKDEIENLLKTQQKDSILEMQIKNSKWVRVYFAEQKFYVVGIVFNENSPKYICYGVPSENKTEPPEALKGFCTYIPSSSFKTEGAGYWIMFQDAKTGACIHIDFV